MMKKKKKASKPILGERLTIKIDGKAIGETTVSDMEYVKNNIIERFTGPRGIWATGPIKFTPLSSQTRLTKKHLRIYNRITRLGLRLHKAGYKVNIKVEG